MSFIEKWTTEYDGALVIENVVIQTPHSSKEGLTKARIARAVACVNALEGIEDVAAARALLDDPRTAAATDMRAALVAMLGACYDLERNDETVEAVRMAREAIAKADKVTA